MKNQAAAKFGEFQKHIQLGLDVWQIEGFIQVLKKWSISDNYAIKVYDKQQELQYNNDMTNLVFKYRLLAYQARLIGLALRVPLIFSKPVVI